MTFEAFFELYEKDIRPRLKENTWLNKEHIIRTKILPFFGKRIISEITTKDVIAWQNTLLAYRDEKRQPYLAQIDRDAQEMFDLLVRQLAEQESITEQLKAEDQMEWVQCMNSIQNRATEIVNHELIYV